MYDFFLWGCVKEKVFKYRPHALGDLKERIIEEIRAIPIEMYRKVSKNFRNRLQQCIAADSRHLSDIIFKA